MRRTWWIVVAALSVGLVGCGDDDGGVPALDGAVDSGGRDASSGGGDGGGDGGEDGGAPDAAREDGGGGGRCGDGVVDEGEECDDANTQNDDFCNRDCTNACGDGTVNAVETCDVGIESGEGACPASCDDMNACTTDVLDGVDCAATCLNAPITACVSGDGCCAPGCTSLDDDDCAIDCGNGVLEDGELCEAGSEIECPTACDDGLVCTTDTLTGAVGTCDAACMHVAITACSLTSDGCCAPGCTSVNDADCSASCGNGVLEMGELCENGTATPCPSSCSDGNVCTTDTLRGSAGSCNAQCAFTPITVCASDGCCAPGCNATNDADCAAVCGNRVVEPGEECDDGNTTPGDGCESCRVVVRPTAFRMNDLDLRDPHAFTRVIICADITGTLNDQIQTAIQRDSAMDMDSFLDLSYLIVFRPLDQASAGGMLDVMDADCLSSTSCVGVTPPLASAPYRNVSSGVCLDTAPGGVSAVRPYSPAVATPRAPCFVSDAVDLTVTISGIPIRLRDAQVAATYSGTPASSLSNGLLRGFITQADAEATILPDTLPAVGGMTLASVLRGGAGNCARGSDQDMHPTHGVGWWFFLNFPAGVVTTYSE